MRIVATTICAIALAGCASDLPYTIAIGDPPRAVGDPPHETNKRPDYKECVLRLDDIVKAIAEDYSTSKLADVKSLQVEFEKQLHKDTEALKGCKDGTNTKVESKGYHPIEEVAKKWQTSYALDTTDPDQDLNRFREYLRSAQLVQHLADPVPPLPPAMPDVDASRTRLLVEERSMRQSQWCGGLTLDIQQTDSNQQPQTQKRVEEVSKQARDCRSLYHVHTSRIDLYEHLLAEIVDVERTGTERNRRYFVLGYEIPWDEERTLVRYGVTFYFRQIDPKNGEIPPKEKHPVELIGYDLTYANEATPSPFVAPETDGTSKPLKKVEWGWNQLPWRITGYPFSLVIGLKNAAFEIAKIPFSLIAGGLIGRDGGNYPVENFLAAGDALYMEVITPPQSKWGALKGLYRLLTETPLVGQLFQYNLGSDQSEPDNLPFAVDSRRKIFLSRGIYGGNKWGQDTGLWALFARQSYPTYDIYSPPYGHGTAIDVVWSMFNLSHGPAYREARYVMEYAKATLDDRLYLAGHSGGVQRSVAASRILSNLGYKVIKVVGIAGPSIGQAVVDIRYPEAFKEYLNTGAGANQDITSKIGNVAGAFTTLLDYSVIVPLKYTLGPLGGLIIWDRERAYRFVDRFGLSNATIVEVERKPSSRHETPMRLSFTDRLVFDAYIRNEFSTAFREDLERADRPENDRPHAFPWKP